MGVVGVGVVGVGVDGVGMDGVGAVAAGVVGDVGGGAVLGAVLPPHAVRVTARRRAVRILRTS